MGVVQFVLIVRHLKFQLTIAINFKLTTTINNGSFTFAKFSAKIASTDTVARLALDSKDRQTDRQTDRQIDRQK